MHKSPRRILIIDDDVDLVTLLVDYFTLEGLQTTPAYNGPEGLAQLKHGTFDLVVLDVMMPGMSGIDVLREIRATSQIPVLMLTARGDPVDRILRLELGADDYVPKPCPPRELVARIGAILRRSAHAEAMIAPLKVGPVTIDPSKRRVSCGDRPIDLTSTEFSLFDMLARSVGKPVAKEDIYPKVLGRAMGPFDRAIDVHVSSIRHKLARAVGKALAIDSIRGVGYQLVILSQTPLPPEEN